MTPTKNESLPELLPCPFCGSTDLHRFDSSSEGETYGIQCCTCWMTSSERDSRASADAAWNQRAALTREAPTEGVDVEAMLVACVPGGSSVDPQTVADNIREWFATPPAPQRMAQGEDVRNLIANLKSMRDRLGPVLAARYGDAFDGDMDTLLDAINHLKRATQPPHQDRGEDRRLLPDWFMFIDDALRDTMSRHKIDPLDGDMVLIANALEDAQRWARERAEAALTEAKQQDGPLSSRLRAGVECAPWVIEEVRKLEAKQQGPGEAVAEVCEDSTGCRFPRWAPTVRELPEPGTKLYTAPQVEAKRQTGEGTTWWTVIRPDGTNYQTDIGGARMAMRREGYRVVVDAILGDEVEK